MVMEPLNSQFSILNSQFPDRGLRNLSRARQVDAAGVRDASHRAQPFLQTLQGGPALAAGEVMQARRDLQQDADERDFVADGLEEELLEQIARLEPVAALEEAQRSVKARVVLERRQHRTRF